MDYDPNLLDDPQWPCGKHKRVLIFPSYMVSSVEAAGRPSLGCAARNGPLQTLLSLETLQVPC